MPDDTARKIHDREQGLAGMRHFGASVAALVLGMIEGGMDRDDAVMVAVAYMRETQRTALKPPKADEGSV